MPNSDQVTTQLQYLQDQKSLKLQWRLFSELGSDRVAVSFAFTSCQWMGHA